MKALSVVGVSEVLVGMRLGGGIVQSQNISKEQIATIFWFTIVGSTILAIIFYFSAGIVANFYEDFQLIPIMQTTSVVVIIMGIGYVPRSLLTKDLRFDMIFYANLAGIILSSVVGVWLALNGYAYWSLVWQWGLFNITISFFYFLFTFSGMEFFIPLTNIKELWEFSKKIMYDDILNYSVRNLDNVLVGKMLGSMQLGFYSRAYGLMLLPLQNFINVIKGVLFPAFAKIQGDIKRIKNVFYLSTQAVSFFLLPLFLFTIIYSNELVEVVFGAKWLPISTILRIFLLLALIQSHTSMISSIFLALGRSDIILKLSYFTKPIIFLSMLLAIQFGMIYLVVSIVILNSISSIIGLHLGLKLINSNLIEYIKLLLPVIVVNSIIYGLCFIQHSFISLPYYNMWGLATILIISLCVYFATFTIIKPKFFMELKMYFKNLQKSMPDGLS